MLCIGLQRAQTAEAESREVLKHSKEQQAKLEASESELLSRPPSTGMLQAVLQGSMSDDSETSRQLLAQVLFDLYQATWHACIQHSETPVFAGLGRKVLNAVARCSAELHCDKPVWK